MILESLGAILTVERKNCRDFESSPLGFRIMEFSKTGPQQGGENEEESGNLELASSENGLSNRRQNQL